MRPVTAPAGPARFSADEFWRMIGAGAFEDMWVELVEGELQRMPPPGNTHSRLQMAVLAALLARLPERLLRPDVAVDLGRDTILACDAAVLREPVEAEGAIPAALLSLVVEVAVSTADRDLGPKRRLYAEAGIPTYWVVDADRRVVHVFDGPEDGDYRNLSLARFGEPVAVPGTDGTIVLE